MKKEDPKLSGRCPECGAPVAHEGGCWVCYACGCAGCG
jgi:ribonucleoside-diphosphate reductase alpha chain